MYASTAVPVTLATIGLGSTMYVKLVVSAIRIVALLSSLADGGLVGSILLLQIHKQTYYSTGIYVFTSSVEKKKPDGVFIKCE